MRKTHFTATFLCLVLLLPFVEMAGGQSPLPLITLTNLWRYNTNNLELGTAWRTPEFNDSEWGGPGLALFGFETDELQYNNLGVYFNTRFNDPQTDHPFVTNYYFRTRFRVPDYPAAVLSATTLITTNWFDDGVIYYLNGVELLRTNVPSGTVTAATFALSALAEPVQRVFANSGTNLVPGENVLAVELHESTTTSSDEVFGMTMTAILPAPVAITGQPAGATNIIGTPVTLSVSATGTNPWYQWYSDGVAITSANSASYSVASNQTIRVNYSVAVSNVMNSLTSAIVVVEYVTDNLPIELVKASSSDPTMAVAANQVLVAFNKRIVSDTVSHDPANYSITVLGTTDSILVTNIQIGSALVKLWADSALGIGTNYVLTVNNVTGTNQIPIAPNSVVGIGMPIFVPLTNLFPVTQPWYWTEQATDLAPGWNATNYVPNLTRANSEYWGDPPRSGLFWHDAAVSVQPCRGSRGEGISWGYNTYYFRTSFVAPANAAASGVLHFSAFLNDGAIFYLNGSEVARIDMPPGPVTYATTAVSSNYPTCTLTNVAITNLMMPGTNVLAVEWHQYDLSHEPTIYFGTTLDYSYTNANPSPLPPRLTIQQLTTTNDGSITVTSTNVITWAANAGGLDWGLEFATNLLATNTIWSPLPNSSPFTNTGGDSRFFRLRARSTN